MASFTDKSVAETIRMESFKDIVSGLAEVLLPPERISVSEAAEKYLVVYNPPAYHGPYRMSKVPYLKEPMDCLESRDYSSVCLVAPAQSGKALPLDTPIATPDGWTTMGELSPGDKVFDESGAITSVTHVTPTMFNHDCYRITFDDQTHIVADAEHRWYVRTKDGGEKIMTTEEMVPTYEYHMANGKVRYRYCVPVTEPLQMPDKNLPIDPYLLGVWLGDGVTGTTRITVGYYEDGYFFSKKLESLGFEVKCHFDKTCVNLAISTGSIERADKTASVFGQLQLAGVFKDKHIPLNYLRGSYKQRLRLLQGLMDTDGFCSPVNGACEISSSIPKLADGIMELLWSMGLKPVSKLVFPKGGSPAYRIRFKAYKDQQVLTIPRKAKHLTEALQGRPSYVKSRWIRKIEPVESVPVRCITVDSPSHLYLAGKQMVPTHNTFINGAWLAYNVVCDPSDFMLVEKSQTEAKNFSLMKADRMIRHSPEIRDRMIQRRTANNVFDKRFKSGTYFTMTWPTVNSLSGKTVRRVSLSDYDRMPLDIGGEGSAFDLARRRTNTYKRLGMTYVESSPSYDAMKPNWRPSSPHEAPPCEGILGVYNRGDRRRRYWQCPHCGEWFEPCFKTLRWPDSADVMESAEAAFMACPWCFDDTGAVITQSMRSELDWSGKWLRDGQKIDKDGVISGVGRRSDIASFWLKGPAAGFSQWKTLVLNYLLALEEYDKTGNDRPLKTTVNTDQGLPYVPPALSDVRAPEDIMNGAKDIGEKVVPSNVRCLIGAIDIQKHRFVVQIMGIVPAEEGFDLTVIDRFDIRKSKRLDEDGDKHWVSPGSYLEDFDLITEQVLDKTYPLEAEGGQMAVRLVLCDSGGAAGVTTNCYNYYRKLKQEGKANRFQLIKGSSTRGAPRVRRTFPDADRKDRKAGARGEIPVLMLNTDLLKDWLDMALSRDKPGGYFLTFPSWLDLSFYQELCVEVKNPETGKWENIKNLRNESTDLICYVFAGCLYLKIDKFNWGDPPNWCLDPATGNNPLVTFNGENPIIAKSKDESSLEKLKRLAGDLG